MKKYLFILLLCSSFIGLSSCRFNQVVTKEEQLLIFKSNHGSLTYDNTKVYYKGDRVYLTLLDVDSSYYLNELMFSKETPLYYENPNSYYFYYDGYVEITPIFLQKSVTKDCNFLINYQNEGGAINFINEPLTSSLFNFNVKLDKDYELSYLKFNNNYLTLNDSNYYEVNLTNNLNILEVKFTKSENIVPDVPEEEQILNITSNMESGCKITYDNTKKYNIGDQITLNIYCDETYYLSDIILSNNEEITRISSSMYSLTYFGEKIDVHGVFNKKTTIQDCALKIISNDYGEITYNNEMLLTNSLFEVTINPFINYKVKEIIFNNENLDFTSNNLSLTLLDNINFLEVNFIKEEVDTSFIVNEMQVIKNVVNIDFSNKTNPYLNVNKNDFYNNYQIATDYYDAYFRSEAYLMSGDIKDQSHLVKESTPLPNGESVKMYQDAYLVNHKAIYEVDQNGNYISYTVNTLDNTDYKVFYNAGYSSLKEVAAYIYGFLKRPINYSNSKKPSSTFMSKWGKFARGNYAYFSGDTNQYPTEPLLTGTMDKYNYIEIDFGSLGDYYVGNRYEPIYNDGQTINRGACRICYTETYKANENEEVSINERHLFYTYNHYSDFQEYLNYEGGFTPRFGNETAGNAPTQYDKNNPPTPPYKILKANFDLL